MYQVSKIKSNKKNTLFESDETSLQKKLRNSIEIEGIFKAAKKVGGMKNLKKIFEGIPDIMDILNSLKGKLDLLGHFKNDIIEFPFEFEVVGIAKNIHETNSWPILNLIYNDSKLDESDKKLLKQFIYSSIADLNIGKLDINPKIRDMYKDGYYVSIDFVNGKNWESLDHDIRYNYNDIKNLHREYYNKINMNESKILQENEDSKLPSSFRRRLDLHKFEKIMKKGIVYVYYDSNSLEEFKNKLIQATLENYIFNKYEKELEEFPQSEIDAATAHLLQVFDPLLTMYYRNTKNERTPTPSKRNRISENSEDLVYKFLEKMWNSERSKGQVAKLDYPLLKRLGFGKKMNKIIEFYHDYMGGIEESKKQFIRYITNKTFTNQDLQNVGVDVGGYNIVFKLPNAVFERTTMLGSGNQELYVSIELIKGTVTLITTGEEYDLMDHDSMSDELWWELDMEIKDMIMVFLIENLNFFGLGFFVDQDELEINLEWY